MATQESTNSLPKRQKINNQNVYDTLHLYLLVNDGWECFKIGVSSVIEERIEKHRMNGFRVVDIKKMPNAKDVEFRIKNFIRGSGFQTGPDLFENIFDGWTECWHRDDLSPSSLDDLIQMAESYLATAEIKKEDAKKVKKVKVAHKQAVIEKSEKEKMLDNLNRARRVDGVHPDLFMYLMKFIGCKDEDLGQPGSEAAK